MIKWRISPKEFSTLKVEIMKAESICISRDQIDNVAPSVLRRLYPYMDNEITAAITTKQPIYFEINWD